MDLTQILGWIGNGIYASMAAVAIYGVFTAILIARRITQKRFRSHSGAEEFLDEVRDNLEKQQYEGVADLCDTPGYWAKAVPQLLLVAVANRNRPINKLRRMMGEHFERDTGF